MQCRTISGSGTSCKPFSTWKCLRPQMYNKIDFNLLNEINICIIDQRWINAWSLIGQHLYNYLTIS